MFRELCRRSFLAMGYVMSVRSVKRALLMGCAAFLLSCGSVWAADPTPISIFGTGLYKAELKRKERCCVLIAHAGGAIDGNAYTNSLEAMQLSVDSGFKLIELDFSRTSDGSWFATHDWKYWAERTGYTGELPPSLDAVNGLLKNFRPASSTHGIRGDYTVMSLTDVIELLEKNRDVTIVTDTKDSDLALQLARELHDSPVFKQFVFQLYSPGDVARASGELPLEQIILTAYQMDDWWRWDGFGQEFTDSMRAFRGIYALTVPLAVVADAAKLGRIQSFGVPILVHARPDEINSSNLHLQLARKGISGVYVD